MEWWQWVIVGIAAYLVLMWVLMGTDTWWDWSGVAKMDKEKKELNQRITNLANGLERHKGAGKAHDTGLQVGHCKKCKHDTLQQRHEQSYGVFVGEKCTLNPVFYRCLTCGSDWTYHTEEVAEQVGD